MELISNRHLSSIFCMKCRYVGGKYVHFMTANNHQSVLDSSYIEFLVMHSPTFADAFDPLKAEK
jgi:hypothetical protein